MRQIRAQHVNFYLTLFTVRILIIASPWSQWWFWFRHFRYTHQRRWRSLLLFAIAIPNASLALYPTTQLFLPEVTNACDSTDAEGSLPRLTTSSSLSDTELALDKQSESFAASEVSYLEDFCANIVQTALLEENVAPYTTSNTHPSDWRRAIAFAVHWFPFSIRFDCFIFRNKLLGLRLNAPEVEILIDASY